MGDVAELKTLIEGIQTDLRNKATNDKIEELIRKIEAKDAKIEALETKVEALEKERELLTGRVAAAENTSALFERKLDDLESYTRRQNLRIVGIPEPEEGDENGDACIDKVKEEINRLGDDVHLDLDAVIDRAHRVGPKRDRQGRRVQRAMIVRFTSWRARTHVYTNRKKGDSEAKFYVDLTKRRFDLKKAAEEKIKDNVKVKFSYADVNNNICLMLDNGTKKFFNSVAELDNVLDKI